jgi:hypothetical protein
MKLNAQVAYLALFMGLARAAPIASAEGVMEVRNASPELREKIEHSSAEGHARLRARGVQPDPDLFDFSYQNCYCKSTMHPGIEEEREPPYSGN